MSGINIIQKLLRSIYEFKKSIITHKLENSFYNVHHPTFYHVWDCNLLIYTNINIDQGGLNKKEIQLNLCNIISIFIFNELYFLFIHLMTLNPVKPGCAATFMKYFTSVASLIFIAKSLIWN